jgi:hypothetical protein
MLLRIRPAVRMYHPAPTRTQVLNLGGQSPSWGSMDRFQDVRESREKPQLYFHQPLTEI